MTSAQHMDAQGRVPTPDEGPGPGLDATSVTGPADDPGHAEEGLAWNIACDDPDNPFTYNLTVTDGPEEVLWWNLDPASVRDLLTALTMVQRAQLAALGGTPATRSPLADPQDPAPATTPRSWWARHKIATALLVLIAIMLLTSFFLGGSQV